MKLEDIEKLAGTVAIVSGIIFSVYYGLLIRKTIKELKDVEN